MLLELILALVLKLAKITNALVLLTNTLLLLTNILDTLALSIYVDFDLATFLVTNSSITN
jgi:hypothetical protein